MSEPLWSEGNPGDVIIVGTGMGGGTLGHALARAGRSVLFCERGSDPASGGAALLGRYPESQFSPASAPQPIHAAELARAGRYQRQLRDESAARPLTFIPFIGEGLGGSSALYGMALERFFPADFTPKRNFPNAADAALPAAWPISYAQLAPYYDRAETLYRVRGTLDPLRAEGGRDHFMPSPPLTPAASELFDYFQRASLHPYRLPMACEFVPGCACCQGYLCDKNCKNDARRICLEPAVRDHGATLFADCEVLRLEADASRVTGVVCRRGGREFTLYADTVVLAAGALESPAILLRSACAHWPAGLANQSGMVGKNLMRHHIDLYLIEPKFKGEFDNRQKEFAFNDFYAGEAGKLGSVQSFGRLPPAPVLAASMADDIGQGPLPWTAPLFKLAKPLVTPVLDKLVKRRMILATTMEDLPYADNGIEIGEGAAASTLRYRVRPHDSARIASFRSVMKQVLKSYSFTLIKQAENNQRIAHVCGTCRFGSDPADSVLDANNRAHGLSNLYIVDASFFPSSGGTNPSLTIAANALRVADHLLAT
ncbi:MAG: glucose-methanol-choline oxidoreductase [Massilia sp.]|nr:glucose-methanol-choline oxidoreductase [Massilia sp.]